MKRKLLLFSAAFTAAAVYCCLLGFGGGFIIAAASGLLCVLLFFSSKRYRPAAIAMLGLAAGMLWCSGYNAVLDAKLQPQYLGQRMLSAQVLQRPKQTNYGYSVPVRIRLESGNFEGTLFFSEASQPLEPADEITCEAIVERSVSDGDYVNYNAAKGKWLTAKATSNLAVRKDTGFAPAFIPAKLSARLQDLCKMLFPEDVCGYLTALLTGSRAAMDARTAHHLKRAGLYHVVAVSGMHTSVLVGTIYTLLRGKRRLTALIGIPVVILFVLMSGAGASAVRAGVMQILFLSAFPIRRENDPPTSLGAAMLFLLLCSPWSICSASLQLSFAAVAGILLSTEKIMLTAISTKLYRNICVKFAPLKWLYTTVAAAFACSVSAAAFTVPLLVYYFGFYSVLTTVSNTLTAWAVIGAFTLGLFSLLLGLLFLPLGMLAAKPVVLLARYVLFTAEVFAKIPFSVAEANDAYFALWLGFAYLLLLFVLFVPKMPKLFSAACILAAYFVCIFLSYAEARTGDFSYTVLDVGQGQCIVLTAGDDTAVIDCGGSDDYAAAQEAVTHLTKCGADRIDALILTHFDRDHVGGVLPLMERYAVQTLYVPKPKEKSGVSEILALAQEQNASVTAVTGLQTVQLGTLRLQIFDANTKEDNNSGICVLASCGEYDILVTGDLSVRQETDMLERYSLPQTEVLVAGHHGAETATGYGILQTVRPEFVLISVGENHYGQPSEQTMDRIRSFGAEIYRTDLCGSITIRR